MPANFKKSTRRVVATALATPWMIEFGVLNQIRSMLEARANGVVRTRDEIEALIGRPAGSKSGVIKAASLNFEPDDDDDDVEAGTIGTTPPLPVLDEDDELLLPPPLDDGPILPVLDEGTHAGIT